MGRFSLRYQAIDLHLGAGDFVAGRAVDCDLVLDDTLVSRRHAVFREREDGVEVEDLGSRNGVMVNDARISGRVHVQHSDRIRIGSHELIVRDTDRARTQPGTAELLRCPACNQYVPADNESCMYCGSELPLAKTATASALPPAAAAATLPSLRPQGAFAVLAQLADKALGLGRFDEAERVLSAPLANALNNAQARAEASSNDVDRDALAISTRYALRLAEALSKPTWLDYPFELFSAAQQLMPADLIDELYRVASKIHYTNPRAIRGYVAKLKSDSESFGPSERFLLQRLEGLERRVGSG